MRKITGLVHVGSNVMAGQNFENDYVVLLEFYYQNANRTDQTTVVVDRGTASKMIRQLQRALDDSYNDMINERDASADYLTKKPMCDPETGVR